MHRANAHYQAAAEKSRLPKASLQEREGSAGDIDDDIVTCCNLEKILDVENIPQKERPTPLNVSTVAELRAAQKVDVFCQHGARLIGTDRRFTVDNRGLSCRKAPVDGALQVAVPECLRQAVFYSGHHSIFSIHPGTRKKQDGPKRRFY